MTFRFRRPDHSLYLHLVVEGGHRFALPMNDEISRKIVQHLSHEFISRINPHSLNETFPDAMGTFAEIRKDMAKAVDDFYKNKSYDPIPDQLRFAEDFIWHAFINTLTRMAPEGKRVGRLIAYPKGQSVADNPSYHLTQNAVNGLGSFGGRFDYMPDKIMVRVTTAPLRDLILGYTQPEHQTIFMGSAGRDTEEQEQEDILVFKEAHGPMNNQTVYATKMALHIGQFLKNSPFTSDEVWEAFFAPESFKMGVYSIC